MKNIELKLLPITLLVEYCNQSITFDLLNNYNQLVDSELSIDSFSFYTSVSAVFSSKIEGENIDLDSYVKHKRFGIAFLPDYTQKIDDLYNAYQFAKSNDCKATDIATAHTMLTKHILPTTQQGKIRTGTMYVTTADGRIEYIAASPYTVSDELQKLYSDIDTLMEMELTSQEVFYFAAMIHLVFVKIHPFNDGNGRSARLIEKWFLANKLGDKAWLIQSEKNYYTHHQTYYNNIRLLGLEYETLDYSTALPFLLMLPNALSINK